MPVATQPFIARWRPSAAAERARLTAAIVCLETALNAAVYRLIDLT